MTDEQNPHYVTPDEAIQKYCVFPTFDGRIQKACTGAACMAWRWNIWWEFDDDGHGQKHISKTYGYCGMVRP